MAEITGLRNNALPYPVYGVPYGLVFPLYDSAGALKTAAGSLDSERSLNGDTFADCTNEATEIGSTGNYYLLLTASEMTADVVCVQVKSSGALTAVFTLFPRKLAVLSTGTCQGSNDTGDIQLASGDSAIDDIYNGCLCVAVIDGTTEARIINDYVGSTKVGEVTPAWNTAQPDSDDTYTIYLPEGRSVNGADVKALLGTAWLTPGTAGTPDVNVKLVNSSSAAAALMALVYAGAAVPFTVDAVTNNGDFTLTGSSLSGNNDDYNDQYLVFTSGNNRSVARAISDYVGATKQVLFSGGAGDDDEAFPRTVQAADTGFIIGLSRPGA